MLRTWHDKFKSGQWEEMVGTELKSVQAMEIERLRRELAEARMERDYY